MMSPFHSLLLHSPNFPLLFDLAPVVVSALPPVVEFDDETLQVNFAVSLLTDLGS